MGIDRAYTIRVAMLTALLALALAGSVPDARTDPSQPPTPAELAAELRYRDCGVGVLQILPGVGQMCTGRVPEGVFLASLTAAEIGAGAAVLAVTDKPSGPTGISGRAVLFVAAQDVWVYSATKTLIDRSLSRKALYAPPDELTDLVVAPFDPRVLKRPAVFGGILALAAGATALQWGFQVPTRFGGRPNLFGAHPPEAVGYPLAAGLHGAVMTHVAIAEEVAFRGVIQSGIARETSEATGFVLGSLIFGPTHALNALLLPEDERVPYLAVAVPWITLTGSWLGLVYLWGNYSLTGPVAVHWWYNMLVSATAFAANPRDNAFSAQIRLRW